MTAIIGTTKRKSPTTDLKKLNEILHGARCTLSPNAESGSFDSITAVCSVRGVFTESRKVIAGDGEAVR